MPIAILSTASDEVDREVIMLALTRTGMQPEFVSENITLEKWGVMDGYILLSEPLTPFIALLRQQAAIGKAIVGIGRGAHFLAMSGFVPGLENNKPAISLQPATAPFESYLRLTGEYQRNAFTKHLSAQTILKLPGEGLPYRFEMSPALNAEMDYQGLNLLLYCDQIGQIPVERQIAAVTNKAGNILAILAEPPDAIFSSMRDYIALGQFTPVPPLNYYPRGKL